MKKMVVVLLLILAVGCIGQEKQSVGEFPLQESDTGSAPPEKESSTQEESLEIAREFVLNSPTYTYDGLDLQHVDTVTLRCPSCWQFIFEFTCRHAGYGDRTKQMVAQVMTHHTAEVTVENGKVTLALLDGTWDMINQTLIE
jgi:hypothetical protein